ncbi:MAG: dUTP diphosphatase [Candidatus Magasanikbacteria bacterium CG10_big_fil_rev_8_21_14_0_10_40_10]|uniref:dUTP diphosphatase n=1 Tax=Candidatus Magasanikbacteria bacterium CG10_big_fil_rev_8_21_14_0_10_40_10 TaxID=1974648 RepID=A0A2M6W3T4_9BACT|nr:MAG: dUTP diphosphatase [Candidatus Magasanikbacteria bacterium CG10_big_fil_rev_8_21_14_0_10_40_10]
MKINIKRVDKTLPLPEYHTAGAVAFDLYSRLDMEIPAKSLALIPSNLIIQTPDEYMLIIVPRSGTPRKKNLLIPHGIGIIDRDYCGPEDEIKMQVYNFSDQPTHIARGERIGQGVFVRANQADWQEKDQLPNQNRGGFGSTG